MVSKTTLICAAGLVGVAIGLYGLYATGSRLDACTAEGYAKFNTSEADLLQQGDFTSESRNLLSINLNKALTFCNTNAVRGVISSVQSLVISGATFIGGLALAATTNNRPINNGYTPVPQ